MEADERAVQAEEKAQQLELENKELKLKIFALTARSQVNVLFMRAK